jgi:hypothetical protein
MAACELHKIHPHSPVRERAAWHSKKEVKGSFIRQTFFDDGSNLIDRSLLA